MMDTVYIKGLNAITTIGVYEHERNIKQALKIDLEMDFDNRIAGGSDDVSDALDYDAISKVTLSYVEASEHFLIEAVAENISRILLSKFAIKKLTVTISKPGAVSAAEDVGIRIVRP